MSSLTLLPLSPDELQKKRSQAQEELTTSGLSPHEANLKLEADFNSWLDNPDNQQSLPESTTQILNDADWFSQLNNPRKPTAGALYNLLITSLSKHKRVERRTAAITLSYLPLIVQLASTFQMSAAGIAKILNKSDTRVLLHWKGIDKILSLLKLNTKLNSSDVQSLIEQDKTLMCELFKDADEKTIVEILRYEANFFELGSNFNDALSQSLTPPDETVFIPYLQTLFYLCTITEFFDHPLEYLYTFKPRGKESKLSLDVFPSSMAPAANPFLNNFKAIDRLSYDWSRSRDDHPAQANALVALTLGLSSLSFSSRQYLARKIRCGLLRYIEIKTPLEIKLTPIQTIEEIQSFLTQVSERETNTRGIIEQRVTDFISSVLNGGEEWRARGLGDPVNATNTASGKLGDADFQNASTQTCKAVEAHAGRLTNIYIDEHLRTLHRNLPNRKNEWRNIADIERWTLEIIFVVHENASTDAPQCSTEGIKSTMQVLTFSEYSEMMFSSSPQNELILESFNQWVINVINAPNTPHDVKEKAKALLEPNER